MDKCIHPSNVDYVFMAKLGYVGHSFDTFLFHITVSQNKALQHWTHFVLIHCILYLKDYCVGTPSLNLTTVNQKFKKIYF